MTPVLSPSTRRAIARGLICLGLVMSSFAMGRGVAQAGEVVVFAAASTTNAITDIIGSFNAAGEHTAIASFASSSTLAKQIEQGAPAGVFLSANVKWMDYLENAALIAEGSRVDLLGNRLALIAPKDKPSPLTEISPETDLAGALGERRLSLGDPDHVPAGIYAKEALTSLGLWDSVADKLAPASDVRAALAFVERDEAPLGIVYSTDAAVSGDVVVSALFPESAHKPITYPAAVIRIGDSDASRAFLDYLRGPEAKVVFERYGFQVKG